MLILLFDPTQCLLKENIRAVACSFYEGVIVFDDGVEITVVRRVGTGAGIFLADPPCSMNKGFVKASIVGLIWIFIA